jgi:hypothetical protein
MLLEPRCRLLDTDAFEEAGDAPRLRLLRPTASES